MVGNASLFRCFPRPAGSQTCLAFKGAENKPIRAYSCHRWGGLWISCRESKGRRRRYGTIIKTEVFEQGIQLKSLPDFCSLFESFNQTDSKLCWYVHIIQIKHKAIFQFKEIMPDCTIINTSVMTPSGRGFFNKAFSLNLCRDEIWDFCSRFE